MKTKFFYDYKIFKNGVLIQYGRKCVEYDWLMVNTYLGKTSPYEAFRQLIQKWNQIGNRKNIAGLTFEYTETNNTEIFVINTPENENV